MTSNVLQRQWGATYSFMKQSSKDLYFRGNETTYIISVFHTKNNGILLCSACGMGRGEIRKIGPSNSMRRTKKSQG
jgi:hypothetical protein